MFLIFKACFVCIAKNGVCNYKIKFDYGSLKLVTAKELFCSLSTKGSHPDIRTYNIMIKGLCK
ncbi:hypothetical protein I3760_08G121500 [Carya illinoinensis]|nr:hypothetical protein I3760_08G121500 [Carya illinoinensis]